MKKAITFIIALVLSLCTSITVFAESESVVYFDSGFSYHHRVSINFPFDEGITSATERSTVILFSPQPVKSINDTAHFKVTHPTIGDLPFLSSVQNQSSTSERDKWITTFIFRAVNSNGLSVGETSAPEIVTVTLDDGSTMDIPCTLELTDIPSIFWRDADTGKMFKNVVGQVGKEQRIQAIIRDYEGLYNSFSIEWEHVAGNADIVSIEGTPGSVTNGMRTDGIIPPVMGKEFVGNTITVIPRSAGERVHLKSRLYDPDGNGLYPFWDVGFRIEGGLQDFENLDDVKEAIQSGAPVVIPPNTGLSAKGFYFCHNGQAMKQKEEEAD